MPPPLIMLSVLPGIRCLCALTVSSGIVQHLSATLTRGEGTSADDHGDVESQAIIGTDDDNWSIVTNWSAVSEDGEPGHGYLQASDQELSLHSHDGTQLAGQVNSEASASEQGPQPPFPWTTYHLHEDCNLSSQLNLLRPIEPAYR